MQLSPIEILLVAAVALIVLGPNRLPQAARQLGQMISEFKKLSSGFQAQMDEVLKEAEGKSTDVSKSTDVKSGDSKPSDSTAQDAKSPDPKSQDSKAVPQSLAKDKQEVEVDRPKPPIPDVEGFRLIDDGKAPEISRAPEVPQVPESPEPKRPNSGNE